MKHKIRVTAALALLCMGMGTAAITVQADISVKRGDIGAETV